MKDAGFKTIAMTPFARLNRINKALHRHLIATETLKEPFSHELLLAMDNNSDATIADITHFFQQNNLIALALLAADRIFLRQSRLKRLPSPSFIERQLRRYESLGLFAWAERQALSCAETLANADLYALKARLAVDRGAYDEALALADRCAEAKAWPQLEARIRAERELLASPQAGSGRRYAVKVVNLPQDYARRDMCMAAMKRVGLAFEFAKAIRVDEIPASDQPLFTRPVTRMEDGTFGNQLTQYRIWRQTAEGEPELTLVFEDDTTATMAMEPFLRHAPLPADADIIFCNDRLCGDADRLTVEPIGTALAELSRRLPNLRAPGSDAYILTRSGAEKLSAIARTEKFHSIGTDWYILSHSIDASAVAGLNPDSILAKELTQRHAAPVHSDIVLNGYITSRPLSANRPLGVARLNRV